MKKIILTILLTFFYAFFATSISAATYYISPTGNDSNTTTQAQNISTPWKTIQRAANATLVGGDIVSVATGTYNEVVTESSSGSENNLIRYHAAGEVTIKGFNLIGNYIELNGFTATQTDCGVKWNGTIEVSGSNSLIRNNTVKDSTRIGIKLTPASNNNTVTNNTIVRASVNGMEINGTNHLIENNDISDISNYVNGCHWWGDANAIVFFGSGHIFRGNYIHNFFDSHQYTDAPHVDAFQTHASNHLAAKNVIIERNRIFMGDDSTGKIEEVTRGIQGFCGFMIEGSKTDPNNRADNITIRNNIIESWNGQNIGGDGGNVSNLKIYNNVWRSSLNISSGWPTGLNISGVTGFEIYNNILLDYSYSHITLKNSSTGGSFNNNLMWNSNGSTPKLEGYVIQPRDKRGIDPKFVSKIDFHLQSSSPAINTGYNLGSLVVNDLDGITRPQGVGYDIGAYEYSGVSCTPNCTGKACGDDGCGSSCGSCSIGQSCINYQCVAPTPTLTRTPTPIPPTPTTTSTPTPTRTPTPIPPTPTSTGVTASINNLTDNRATYPSGTIPKYDKFELTFDINGLSTVFPTDARGKFTNRDLNPFNPDIVDVEGIFSPPGCNFSTACTIQIPGFWYQDFTVTNTNGTDSGETIIPGPTKWKIRFTPQTTGTYQYYLKIIERGVKTAETQNYSFITINSTDKGFIRKDTRDISNSYYYKFDNGDPYIPIGIGLPPGKSLTILENVFSYLKQNNVNFVGYTDGLSFFKLEWFIPPYPAQGHLAWYQGFGRYNLVAAYKQDKIIEMAKNNDIYLNVNWSSENLESAKTGYGSWEYEPYRISKGGVITTPLEFYTNTDAKKYFKRKTRYFMSRYAYSPFIMNLETMNEYDWPMGSEGWKNNSASWQPVINWFSDIGNYVKNQDPYDHLLSGSTGTSSWNVVTRPADYQYWRDFWALPVWDVIHAHSYQGYPTDTLGNINCQFDTLVDTVSSTCNDPIYYPPSQKVIPPHYGLPLMIGEWATNDKTGSYTVNEFHDAIWMATINGGSILPWFYDYASSNNMIPVFKGLSAFMLGENLGAKNMKRIRFPTTDKAQLQAYGLANGSSILGWVVNTGTLTNGVVTFPNMQNGSYNMEIWDAWNGTKLSTTFQTAVSGSLSIPVNNVSHSLAFKANSTSITPTPTIPVCIPNCTGRACGDDGCGSSCGSCAINYSCINFQCIAPTPTPTRTPTPIPPTSTPTTSTGGNTYYVSPTGNDANSGTSGSTAWQSVDKVNNFSFQPGDEILFQRGGIWTGNGGSSTGALLITRSGIDGQPITFGTYGTGEKPIFENPGNGSSNTYSIRINGSYIIVEDLLVRNAFYSGIYISQFANNNIVRNIEATNVGIGVAINGANNLITQNYIHDLKMIVNDVGGTNDYGAVGVEIFNGPNEISYNRLINCIAPSYDFINDGGAVEIYLLYGNADGSSFHHNYSENTEGFIEMHSVNLQYSANNVTISQNVIKDVTIFTDIGMPGYGGGHELKSAADIKLENNTYQDSKARSVKSWEIFSFHGQSPTASQVYIRNNIIYSKNASYIMRNGSSLTHKNNIYELIGGRESGNLGFPLDPSERWVDPQFIDVVNNNLHLKSTSPAINIGANLGYTLDFDGNPIPYGSAPDIGAYEYSRVACIPNCVSKACGDDGCGSICGSCSINESCINFQCIAPTPTRTPTPIPPTPTPTRTPTPIPPTPTKTSTPTPTRTPTPTPTNTSTPTLTPTPTLIPPTSTNTPIPMSTNTPIPTIPVCIPNCTGKACGDDECGSSCGSCAINYSCINYQCVAPIPTPTNTPIPLPTVTPILVPTETLTPTAIPTIPICTPSCVNKACGDDECGSSCGSCGISEVCLTDYTCGLGEISLPVPTPTDTPIPLPTDTPIPIPTATSTPASIPSAPTPTIPVCTPNCTGKACGDDGCGSSCGSCQIFEICKNDYTCGVGEILTSTPTSIIIPTQTFRISFNKKTKPSPQPTEKSNNTNQENIQKDYSCQQGCTLSTWINFRSKEADKPLIMGKYDQNPIKSEYLLTYNKKKDLIQFNVFSGNEEGYVDSLSFGSPPINSWIFVISWYDPVEQTINTQINNGQVNSQYWRTPLNITSTSFVIAGQNFEGLISKPNFQKTLLSAKERSIMYNESVNLYKNVNPINNLLIGITNYLEKIFIIFN